MDFNQPHWPDKHALADVAAGETAETLQPPHRVEGDGQLDSSGVEARLLSYHSGLRSRPSFSLEITSDDLSCFLTSADSTSPAQLVIRRRKLAHGAVDGAVRHPAIDRLVVVVAVEDEAVPALGDDVEDIGRPDLEVLRASEAKNCDLLIEIGGRMDEVCESCHKVF
jgi:hypothetical protein